MFEENLLKKYALPESVTNSQGLWYDPRADVWKVSSSSLKNLYFTRYREECTPEFLQSLKLAMVSLHRRLKPNSLQNCFKHGLNPLMKRMPQPVGQITQSDLEEHCLALPPERKWWLNSLKSLGSALGQFGIPGHSITPDALAFLKTLKPGCNEQGQAAATWDPVAGPLTPDEMEAFLRALDAAFVRAEVSLENYVLILLFASFGARAANMADLKVCDLQSTVKSGVTTYVLHIPRVKQQGGRFRQESYTRKVFPELAVLLESFIERQKERYASLGCGDRLPVFVDPGNRDPIRTFHRDQPQIAMHAIKTANRLAVVSLRTGEILHVNTRRYRHTTATVAKAMGFSPGAIAALLDHGSTQTQEVYAAISPALLRDYTERLGGYRNPLAAAFLGRIAEPGESVAPGQWVFRPRFAKDSPDPVVGGCEASRQCAGRRPYVCYLCPLFTASMEGDHEGALADVVEERVRFDQEAGDALRFMTQDSVAGAIRKVIDMVEERLKELGKTLEQIRQEKEALLRQKGVIA